MKRKTENKHSPESERYLRRVRALKRNLAKRKTQVQKRNESYLNNALKQEK